MRYIVLVISAVWLAVAITVSYAPEAVASFLALEWIGPWMRPAAAVPVLVGLVLIAAAGRFRLAWYVRIIGILALLKGAFFLAAPAQTSHRVVMWYIGLSATTIRVAGLVSVVGALILAAVAIVSLFEENVV